MITIDDDDDDPISEMKLHLHESYIATGFQKSIEVVDVLDSPSYSPTQSPDPLSPIYLPPDCDFSPPDSPSDCQVVEASPPPQPPPLPPPVSLPPPPPPPPISIYPEPVPCLRAEPLPPGEDIAPEISYCPPPPQAPLDMDLDSGDEAESQFFRKQRIEKEECIFPESVWGFGGSKALEKSPAGRKRKEMDEKREGEELRRSKRRKRKSSSRDKENQKRVDKAKEAPSLEDDEEALRAILLAQVSKAQTKKPVQDPVKEVQEAEKTKPTAVKEAVKEVVKEDVSKAKNLSVPPGLKADNAVTVQKAPPKSLALDPPPSAKPQPDQPKPTSVPPPPPPPQTKPVVKAAKVTQPLKVGKPGKVSRRPSNSSLSNKTMPTLSKAEREKHFPNLSRKIIIPNIGDNTDSEDENETIPAPQPSKLNGSMSSVFGGLNLEAFLKEARNTAAPPSIQSNSNKPAQPRKKLMMTPKLKAQAQKLTLADKKKLISSKISHLSRSTQIEYQRLKEILAKKEREKVIAKRDGAQKKSGDLRVVKNPPKSTVSLNAGSPKCVTPDMPLSKTPETSSTGDEPLQVLNSQEDATLPDSSEKFEESKPSPAEDSKSLRPEESSAVAQDATEQTPVAPRVTIVEKPPVAESLTTAGETHSYELEMPIQSVPNLFKLQLIRERFKSKEERKNLTNASFCACV